MSHSDNEEQVLEIKEFFAKTWKIMVAVIIIGLLAIWGWRYWQSHNTERLTESSDKYEQLLTQLDPNKPTSVDELVSFAKENDTIYSVFASLQAAKFYAEDLKDYSGAETLLADASKKTDKEAILSIINLRIARLQYQRGEYDASLQSLNKVNNDNWTTTVNDLRGDILVKMKEYSKACDAYEAALAADPEPNLAKNIQMKLNEAEYLKAAPTALTPQVTTQEQVEKTESEPVIEGVETSTQQP